MSHPAWESQLTCHNRVRYSVGHVEVLGFVRLRGTDSVYLVTRGKWASSARPGSGPYEMCWAFRADMSLIFESGLGLNVPYARPTQTKNISRANLVQWLGSILRSYTAS